MTLNRAGGRRLKVAIVGAVNTGKTALWRHHVFGVFKTAATSTVAADYAATRIVLESGRVLAIDLWDTAGQERFAEVMTASLRHLDGALVVYALNDHSSFVRAEHWVHRIREQNGGENGERQPPIVLVGNKQDTLEPTLGPTVLPSEIALMARRLSLTPCESSALTGAGVALAFQLLGSMMELRQNFQSAFRPPKLTATAAVDAEDVAKDDASDIEIPSPRSTVERLPPPNPAFKLHVPPLDFSSLDAQLKSWVVDTARQTPRPATPLPERRCPC